MHDKPIEKPKAVIPSPAPLASPPSAGEGPTRSDQVQCPSCGRWRCPAVNGTHRSGRWTYRYRCCDACGRTFKTRQVNAGPEEFAG
jgi:hypothetical protein